MTHLELQARAGPDAIRNLKLRVGISEANREVKGTAEASDAANELCTDQGTMVAVRRSDGGRRG